jgi:hypothetical protein
LKPLYFTENGIVVPTGWRLTACNGISADGMTFAGTINNPNDVVFGFVVHVPAPASVVLMVIGLAFGHRRRERACCA